MVKKLLVTTSIKKTWESDLPICFLGEWCILYDQKDYIKNIEFEVANYHWNDRKKLFNDFNFINKFYEEILIEITPVLNRIHLVEENVNYWRLIIGPWLGVFLQVLYDRWYMLDCTIKNKTNSYEVNVLNSNYVSFIPSDMNDFQKKITNDDWNEVIYSEILFNYSSILINKIDNISNEIINEKSRIYKFFDFKKITKSILNRVSGLISKSTDVFIISSYLPFKKALELHFKLGQIPKFWYSPEMEKSDVDCQLRQILISKFQKSESFEQIARMMIFKFIPISYLENFKKILEETNKIGWPKNPKAIFTSNNFFEDEFFKIWTAEKQKNNSALLIGQHGGNYGTSLFNFSEGHEIKISDFYFTWGWKFNNMASKKVKPLFNLKISNTKIKYDKNGCLLLVTMALPRYSYQLYSVPIASQYLNYLQSQFDFVEALPEYLQKQILVRLFPQDFGWSQKERWIDRFPNINIDNGKENYLKQISKCKIFISTYNATTFLETLSFNVPTIIYWDPEYWELRDEAIPFFRILEEVGILHFNVKSAVSKLLEILNNVDQWWFQENTQNAIKLFCIQFSNSVENPINILKNTIESSIQEKQSKFN